jgi:hypothetical protein
LPWYFYVPVLLPFVLPILGGWAGLLAAFFLSAVCLGIVQLTRLPAFLRMALSIGISLASYAIAIAIMVLVWLFSGPTFGYADKPTIPPKQWQNYTSPDGDFEVSLPGKPEPLSDPYPGVQVKLTNPEATFRVFYFTVGPDRRLDLADPEVRSQAAQHWPELTKQVLRDYNQSEPTDGGVQRGPSLPYSFRLHDSNRKRKHRVLSDIHYNRFGDRFYCATVSTPHTNAMEYDVNKFFQSVRVSRPGR